MTQGQRVTASANAAKIAFAAAIIVGGALALAGQASADPDPAVPAPGQPVVDVADGPVGPPPPPPVGPPMVPEIANPVYGASQSGGTFGAIRDIFHQVRDGNPTLTDPDASFVPPPGAGPAPKLPPGFTSLTDPSSSTPATPSGTNMGGPALPPGYYPLNGPPPPGYAPPPAADPAAAPVDPTP